MKCCCGNKDRKRQQGKSIETIQSKTYFRLSFTIAIPIQIPQPIFVHSGPSPYQQQQHSGWNPMMMPTSPESRPMLPPQPSAPPHPNDFIHTEHPPPPYEKLYK